VRSLILKKPGEFELQERPIPDPGSNDVLVKVLAAAICHTDFIVMDGEHSLAEYPCILGHEFSGIAEKCGENVFHVKPGDRVTSMSFNYCGLCPACRRGISNACERISDIPFHMEGAFQEYISVNHKMIFPISESLSFENAALVEPAANGFAVVERANIYPGEKIVIIGPGPIGLLTLQFAALKQPGNLIMNGTREERLQLATEFGATHTINVRKEDPFKRIMEITDGYGADVVFFCGGGEDAWKMAESILVPFGRVIIEALPSKVSEKWPVTFFKFVEKAIGFLGVCGYNSSQFGTALYLVEAGKISISPLITHRFPLEEYSEAFETSKKRIGGAIKVIFNSF